LENMMAHSRVSFFVIFGMIFIIGAVFFLGLYKLQNSYLEKEQEVEKEKREKERFREISAFTSGVAHEIKNPLNSISLLCELMRKRVPEELQKDVTLCKNEVHKISGIIDQFSAAQKPLKLKKEKFNFEDLVRSVQSSLKNEIKKRQTKIVYSQSGPIAVYADKQLIGQSLINLLKNALEAGVKGEILVHASEHKNTVQMTVQDFGKGIAEEDKQFIFYPFFSKKEEGMGIGLYLTKKIVEAHGGKIEFQSEQGKGTTFSVLLPRGRHE
jgi:signal transduction histidine kinase